MDPNKQFGCKHLVLGVKRVSESERGLSQAPVPENNPGQISSPTVVSATNSHFG